MKHLCSRTLAMSVLLRVSFSCWWDAYAGREWHAVARQPGEGAGRTFIRFNSNWRAPQFEFGEHLVRHADSFQVRRPLPATRYPPQRPATVHGPA